MKRKTFLKCMSAGAAVVLSAISLFGGTLNSEAADIGKESNSTAMPAQGIAATALTTEAIENPLGIDVARPEFAWKPVSSRRAEVQTAYRVLVSESVTTLSGDVGDMWDSGKVVSDRTIEVHYQGRPLASGRTYFWKVCLWDDNDEVSDWSDVAQFETGLMAASDWQGRWILARNLPAEAETGGDSIAPAGPMGPTGPESAPTGDAPGLTGGMPGGVINDSLTAVSMIRKEFDLEAGKTVDSARLYMAAAGYCYIYLNGRQVGDWVLNPVESARDRRMSYTTFDVTSLLQRGRNAMGVELASGPMILQLNIRFTDGTSQSVVTDTTWKTTLDGPIAVTGISFVEYYDARKEKTGWWCVGYDDTDWQSVFATDSPTPLLEAQMLPVLRVTEEIRPVSAFRTADGDYVFDAGRIVTGWVRLTGAAPEGTEIVIRYSEQRNEDGTAKKVTSGFGGNQFTMAEDRYIFKGEGVESWSPRFTYKGFRYVQISGYSGELDTDDVVVAAIHSDVKRIGAFSSSNTLLNTLHKNMQATILNNLQGVITTTPVYERGLTTGDVSFAAESMLYNFDMSHILMKSVVDLADSQAENGALPELAPNTRRSGYIETVPEWTSLIVNIPWYLYQYAGVTDPIDRFYDTIKRYADYEIGVIAPSGYIGDSFFGGDWNSPEGEMSPEGGAITGTAYQYRTMQLLTRMAAMRGLPEDAGYYGGIADKIRAAMNTTLLIDNVYETPVKRWTKRRGPPTRDDETASEGMPVGYRQTSNLIPIAFGIVPEIKRDGVLNNLIADIHDRDDHLDTGCIGTKYLLLTLTEAGYGDLAYAIATRKTFPGWGYWVENGATTMWEGWNLDCRSRDHFYLGSGIEEWFFKQLAGIRSEAAGFKEIVIKPYLLGDLTHVAAHTDTARGLVSSEWRKTGDNRVTLTVSVPVNTFATVHVPCGRGCIVTEGGKPAEQAEGVRFLRSETGYRIYHVGSGSYRFVSQYDADKVK